MGGLAGGLVAGLVATIAVGTVPARALEPANALDGPARAFLTPALEACEALRQATLTAEEAEAAVLPYQQALNLGPPHGPEPGQALIQMPDGSWESRIMALRVGASGTTLLCTVAIGRETLDSSAMAAFGRAEVQRITGAALTLRGEPDTSSKLSRVSQYLVGDAILMSLAEKAADPLQTDDYAGVNMTLTWMAAQQD